MIRMIALLNSLSAAFVLTFLTGAAFGQGSAKPQQPNIVIIYADDLGYGDLGCYGGHPNVTPNIDRLARQGARFTDFYSAQPVCSASRAALLTGCYPNRIGIAGALSPSQNYGLNHSEMTLAQLLKQQNYATAIYGKWHLGHHPGFLPTTFAFDQYFGLPYSNDMSPMLANNPRADAKKAYPPLPLFEGTKLVATEPDQSQLTTWYTERAVKFIEQNRDQPFLLYVPHSMPHVPLYVSDKFAGKSGRGLYQDVLAEIDWSVGQIVDAIDQYKLAERTLVIFSSDNGPWKLFGDHGGIGRFFARVEGELLRRGRARTLHRALVGTDQARNRDPSACDHDGLVPNDRSDECSETARSSDRWAGHLAVTDRSRRQITAFGALLLLPAE